MISLNSTEGDMQVFMDLIKIAIDNNCFDSLNLIFAMNPTQISLELVVALLIATLDIKDKLPQRAVFFKMAQKHYTISKEQWEEIE